MKTPPKVLLVVALAAAGCGGETPEPTKLEPGSDRPRIARNRTPEDEYHNPNTQKPKGREGAQVSPEELDKLLADADVEIAAGRDAQAQSILFGCANREPASGACDARMGILLARSKNRRETAEYYLLESALSDDPKLTPAIYDQLAEELRKRGEVDTALVALDKAIAREDAPARQLARARILEAIPARREEAADGLAAIRKQEHNDDLLFEEAVIRAQVMGQAGQAAALFEEYLERTKDKPEAELELARGELKLRIAALKESAQPSKKQNKSEQPG